VIAVGLEGDKLPGPHHLPDNAFASFQQLSWLNITSASVKELPADIFAPLHNLSCLLLSLEVKRFPAGMFDQNTQLQVLYLIGNSLGSLEEGLFRHNTQLSDLDLRDNELSALPSGIFKGLTKLARLMLTNNYLTQLDEAVFADVTGLAVLSLSKNYLSSIPESLLKGLSDLWLIFADQNQLTYFGHFTCWCALPPKIVESHGGVLGAATTQRLYSCLHVPTCRSCIDVVAQLGLNLGTTRTDHQMFAVMRA